jgi:hypothetical protein
MFCRVDISYNMLYRLYDPKIPTMPSCVAMLANRWHGVSPLVSLCGPGIGIQSTTRALLDNVLPPSSYIVSLLATKG